MAVQKSFKTTTTGVRVCRFLTPGQAEEQERELTATTHLIAVGNQSLLYFLFLPPKQVARVSSRYLYSFPRAPSR